MLDKDEGKMLTPMGMLSRKLGNKYSGYMLERNRITLIVSAGLLLLLPACSMVERVGNGVGKTLDIASDATGIVGDTVGVLGEAVDAAGDAAGVLSDMSRGEDKYNTEEIDDRVNDNESVISQVDNASGESEPNIHGQASQFAEVQQGQIRKRIFTMYMNSKGGVELVIEPSE